MILTVTPNTTLDHPYVVDRLLPGEILTAQMQAECVGGKGGLLAAFAVDLGVRSVALGFAAGENAHTLARLLRRRGVCCDFSPAQGETRRIITIVEREGVAETILIPVTLRCTNQDVADLLQRAARWLAKSSWLALCGSLAQGCAPDLYCRLVFLAQQHRVPVLIDSRGAALRQALRAVPTVIKLNRRELEQTVGRRCPTIGSTLRALGSLVTKGVELAVCTLGAEGAVAVTRDERWAVVPPRIKPVNTTGAGDAFAAGLLVAREKGFDWPHALRWAVAAGTAKALEWRTDGLAARAVRAFYRRVKLRRL